MALKILAEEENRMWHELSEAERLRMEERCVREWQPWAGSRVMLMARCSWGVNARLQLMG
jgi:hypothetical protein